MLTAVPLHSTQTHFTHTEAENALVRATSPRWMNSRALHADETRQKKQEARSLGTISDRQDKTKAVSNKIKN
jgi:hypothetical protein